MPLDEVERALRSLRGWKRVVGCMGGEPTIHPQFEEICMLYKKYFPREQCGLWTSGGPAFEKNRFLIAQTFRTILYNDHSEVGKHQPWMIAIDEVVEDERMRNELIDHCWVQKLWSPSINPKGAFFCEIAAVFDLLFDGPGGFPVDVGWWRKDVADFQEQIDCYCKNCGMAIPYARVQNDFENELVSPRNYQKLREINSPWNDRLKVVDTRLTLNDIKGNLKDYAPWEYLGEGGVRDKHGKVRPGYAAKRTHQVLSA